MIAVVSCNLTDNDCGPFDEKFKTFEFNTNLKNISISDNPSLNLQYNTLESDTIGFDKFALAMFPIGESYSLNSEQLNSFSLLPSAFACSPPIAISEEIITDIDIFSNRSFNSEYTSTENIAELFEIVVLYRNSGYQRSNLNEFLSSEPNVPDEIFLVLKSAPETTEPIQFTVKYSQDGIDMDSYEFTTVTIVITN
tara:strand:+ start:806 stop:1393 length:588 start_codon:yes stop_codon:yes gene_type:complete